MVVVDLETSDPNLKELGNGAIRKDGQILVAGVYDGKLYQAFRPGDHGNWERFKQIMGDPSIDKIAHNGVYDYDWIQNGYGIKINGKLEDTMTRAGLLNEYAGHYDLTACCQREGVAGKNNLGTIEQWWKDRGAKGSVYDNMGLIPNEVLEQYNEQDCKATWNLYKAQQPKLEQLELQEVNDLEAKVLRFVLRLRKNGFRIDVNKVNKAREQVAKELEEGMYALERDYGTTSLTKKKGEGSILGTLSSMGVAGLLLSTPTGGKSVAYDSLMHLQGLCEEGSTTAAYIDRIIHLNRKNTLMTKYLDSAFIKFTLGDHIHGFYSPTQRDDGGTITARFASSKPNMQNFSAMEEKDGDLVRGCFIPEEDHWLLKADYSQIEYTLFAHYAIGPGSMALQQAMRDGKDYHSIAQEMLGWEGKDGRRRVKNFNFGVIYGMGLSGFKEMFEDMARKSAKAMGMTADQYTTHYYNEYYRRMTFIRPTVMSIQELAKRAGFVTDICNRIHRVPPDGGIYKIVNYLIQGGAAGINKRGLVKADEAGIFDVLIPHATVHDEADCSVPKTKEGLEACKELCDTMCSVATLKVPIRMAAGIGDNWYEAGSDDGEKRFEDLCKEFGV